MEVRYLPVSSLYVLQKQGTDVDRARIELRQLIDPIKVEPAETDIRLYNEQGRLEAAWLRAVGSAPTAS